MHIEQNKLRTQYVGSAFDAAFRCQK